MEILCDVEKMENVSTCTGTGDPMGLSESTAACVPYDFKLVGGKVDSGLRDKELQGKLSQWGLENAFSVTQAQFTPAFMPHQETSFVRQLLTFAAENGSGPHAQSGISVQSVQWETLKCTATSMSFFDCLHQKGIVNDSGDIRGCYHDVFDGITVSNKLRELLVNSDSENADTFSLDEQRELLFHVFRALCVGGGVCQPDDRLDAYTRATKTLYKELVSVRKNASTDKLEIAPCKVYRITGINGRSSTRLGLASGGATEGRDASSSMCSASADPESPHDVCLLVVDLAKRRASVLRKEYLSFW